jgi:hypothetical protein
LSILNWFALLYLLLIKLTEELAKVDEKLKLTESLLETRVMILHFYSCDNTFTSDFFWSIDIFSWFIGDVFSRYQSTLEMR